MNNSEYKLDPPEAPVLTEASYALPHPGLWVRSMIDDAGLTVVRACELMKINRPNFIDVLKGPTEAKPNGVSISRDLAYRLDALLNSDGEPFDLARLLLARQAEYDWWSDSFRRVVIRQGVRKRMDPNAISGVE